LRSTVGNEIKEPGRAQTWRLVSSDKGSHFSKRDESPSKGFDQRCNVIC
jgi:hypothetical protein